MSETNHVVPNHTKSKLIIYSRGEDGESGEAYGPMIQYEDIIAWRITLDEDGGAWSDPICVSDGGSSAVHTQHIADSFVMSAVLDSSGRVVTACEWWDDMEGFLATCERSYQRVIDAKANAA